MNKFFVLLACALITSAFALFAAPEVPLAIVEDGRPNAEIVLAPERPRLVTLAALELRQLIEKITGARLPIVTEPTATQPIKIYVGQSPGTDKLGVTAKGLKDGACRMVSGPDWIVLIGKDFDFDPSKYPMAKKRGDMAGEEKWAAETKGKTDSAWGYPFSGAFKSFWRRGNFLETMAGQYGEDAKEFWPPVKDGELLGLWQYDEGGSLNAVYGLLRSLGARWYMPGELGEILPEKSAYLAVGPLDETVVPDYALRKWHWTRHSAFGFDDMIWSRRLGINSGFEQLGLFAGPHGLVAVHSSDAMKKAHPEYYALIGGKRNTEGNHGRGTPCFTSEGMQKETVNYIRHIFDTYDFPSVDIWPGDGLQICQCDTCKGKSASELVWEFSDRVAREVYKTHPDKIITAGAYTSYIEAPDTIEKFSPNLAVWIANSGRPRMMDPEHWTQYEARVKKWQSKIAPGNIYRLENNRYHVFGMDEDEAGVRGGPIYYPAIHPRAMARELKALKGIASGFTGEMAQISGQWKAPGLEHLTLYVQSRFFWDADLDVDEVLDEYYATFYGPAAAKMKAAIDFAEANMSLKDESKSRGRGNVMNVSLPVALKLRDLLDEAKEAAGETIYGERVQAVVNDLQTREKTIAAFQAKEVVLAEARANAPTATIPAPFKSANREVPDGSATAGDRPGTYSLKARYGQEAPSAETKFQVSWEDNTLLLDIVCQEPEMAKLKVGDDVNSGDYVSILIETPNHSYYHIDINPEGKMVEGNPTQGWESQAHVKTERGPDFWRVQVRIPVVGTAEAESDPNHRVAGAKPTKDHPWFFNVGRMRVADLEKPEIQIFSQTGGGWHFPAKFGKLISQ